MIALVDSSLPSVAVLTDTDAWTVVGTVLGALLLVLYQYVRSRLTEKGSGEPKA